MLRFLGMIATVFAILGGFAHADEAMRSAGADTPFEIAQAYTPTVPFLGPYLGEQLGLSSGFSPAAFPGYASVFLGDTSNYSGTTAALSNYFCADTSSACTTATAAFQVPTQLVETSGTDPGCHALSANQVCSWTLLYKFRYTLNAFPAPGNALNPLGIAGNCGSGCFNTPLSSNDRFFGVTLPGFSTTQTLNNEFRFNVNTSGATTNLLISPISNNSTGLLLIPGHNYCVAITQYAADGSGVGGGATDGVLSVAINDASNGSAPVSGSPLIVAGPNDTSAGSNLYFAGTSTARTKATIDSLLGHTSANIGVISTNGLNAHGSPGPFADFVMVYGAMPNSAGAPTAALLHHFCDGSETPQQWVTELQADAASQGLANPVINAWYPLNPVVGVTLSIPSPSVLTTAPTVTTALQAAGAATYRSAAPLTLSAALTIRDFGDADVFRVEPGQGAVGQTGTIYRTGTYNVSALGGTPTGIDMQVYGGPAGTGNVQVAWTTATVTIGGGVWTAKISGLPANYITTAGGNTANATPYNVSVRPTNAPSYVVTSYENDYIGLVEPDLGQSEKALMFNTGTIESTNSVQIPAGDIIVNALGPWSVSDPLTSAPAYTSNCGVVYGGPSYGGCPSGTGTTFAVRQLITSASGPQNTPGSGTFGASVNCSGTCLNTGVGDGALEKAVTLATLSNLPVRIGYVGKTGTPVDAWLAGYQTDTATVTNTAGTLSFTSVMAHVNNPATGTNGTAPSGPWIGGVYYDIEPGSVVITDGNGCVFANDAGASWAATGTLVAVANSCVGSPSLTAGGTLTYSPTGATSVAPSLAGATITGSPSGTITATYTTLETIVSGAYARQMSIANAVFTGNDMTGSGTTPGTGIVINAMNQMSGPPNAWNIEQANANMGLLNTTIAPSNNTSGYNSTFQTEWECVFTKCVSGTSIMGRYWWYQSAQIANTIVNAEGYSRDTAATPNNWQNATQYFINWGNSLTNGGLTTPHTYGGSYPDITLQAQTLGVGSPHQDSSPFGTIRMGRREGIDEWYNYLGQSAPEPTLVSAAFNTTITAPHSALCAVTGKCIDITFAPAAGSSETSLQTCNGTLAGSAAIGNTPPWYSSGSCTPTGVGSTVMGLSFGEATSGSFFDNLGNDISSTSTSLAATSDGYGGSCTIITAWVVECVQTTASAWVPGSTYVKFNPQWNTNGSLVSASLSGYTGWTGSSPFTAKATGGTCGTANATAPQVSIVNTAGVLTIGSRVSQGKCTVAPTGVDVTHFTGGVTGTATVVIATPATDIANMGWYLYGNDGTTGPYASAYGNCAGTAGCEPGQPVTVQDIPIGPF